MTKPLATRQVSLVDLDSAESVAYFRTAERACDWARRIYGRRWQLELLVWDEINDKQLA
jgi:hypothetical protein